MVNGISRGHAVNGGWIVDRPVGSCDDLLICGENEDIRNDRRPMEGFSRNRNSNDCLKVVGVADGQNFSDSLNADCRMAMIYGTVIVRFTGPFGEPVFVRSYDLSDDTV